MILYTRLTHLFFPPIARVWGVVLMTLLVASSGLALERPSPAELDQLLQNPDAFLRQQQRALRYGNHKISPDLLKHATQKMASLAKGEDPNLLPPSAWRGMPTKGTNNVLIFLIDFPDEVHVNSYDTITNKLFGAGIPADFPLESLAKFYQRSSYGQLTIKGSTLGWYRMAHNRDWYTTTYGDGNYANYQIIKEVADHFDATINYSQFDNNGDGKIDYFAVLWAGPDNGWANFWWGYQWELQTDLTLDGVQFYSFSWQWESNPSYTGSAVFTPNVIIHETGHALGLPDYYDYQKGLGPEGGVGGMDMMDANYCDHNCFSKFVLDWITPTVVTGGLLGFPQRNSADYPEAVALARTYTGVDPFDEFFMVQNRQKVNNDQNLPNSGLVVWHIDARLNAGGTDYQYNNSYASHKLLRLMEADGLEQIEAGGSANAGDFYVAGKEFTPESTPNSHLYSGATSEVRVTAITASNQVMLANYSVIDNAPILAQSRIYVTENTTTNVSVTLFQQPLADTVVTVSWLSGSPNLYVVGSPSLTFTTNDWAVPQTFDVGALNDADMINDVAVFRMTAVGGGVQSANFVVEQMDTGDHQPPHCAISGSVSADRTVVYVDFIFDEAVNGFDSSDVLYTSNISGGITPVGFEDLGGTNQTYRASYSVASPLGSLTITIPAGSLTDKSGNANPNEEYQFTYTLPWVKDDFFDDMEGGIGGWTVSTQAMANIQTKAWEWGIPTYIAGPSANSGTHCWGTVMTNVYPDNMNSWLMTPSIPVGANPTLDFYLWLDLESGYDVGFIEVYDGVSWVNVTPGGYYTGATGGWVHELIGLDNTTFGNRTLKIRFRTTSDYIAAYAGMYVDDVRVQSQRDPGLWLVSYSPVNAPAGTTNPVTFTIYNSLPTTVAASADVSSPDFGVTVLSGSPVSYGLLAPGEVASSLAPVMLQLDAAGNFDSPKISLFHQARNGGVAQVAETVPFMVDGVSNSVSTNALTVKSLLGVTDWLGGFLTGNGGATSAIFQVIYAGPDGLKNAPQGNGQVTGDDRILYSTDVHLPYGRIGEGVGILPNAGSFLKTFSHNLSATAKVYVRAWDAASFAASAAYGDSALYTLTAATNQTHDYGRWAVVNPAPGSFGRDTDGDSLSDGWCVLHGLSANNPIVPLACKVVEAKAVTDVSFPNRVAVSSNFVFIADMNNKRVQVWDRALTTRKFVLGATSGVAATNFGFPRGVAVTRDGTRLAVADTGNSRVRLFAVNPVSGALSSLFDFGSNGTNTSQFNRPMAVAFGSADEIYVADSDQSASVCNNRIQVFSSNGVFQSTFGTAGSNPSEFQRLLGVGMGADGTLYAADGVNNRVQAFSSGSTFAWEFGTGGTGVGQFNRVWDAQPGLNRLLYVTDSYNNRIQVVNLAGAPSVAVSGVFSNAGTLGTFNFPQSAASAPDDHVLYVADTLNNRVLRLRVTMDADGDGMDDVWEVLHGLNPQDPSDAFGDPDGDGTLNIGEYRAGTDPQSGTPGINLKISSIVVAQGQLSWLALSGYVYRVQISTDLMQNAWVDGLTTTSKVDGALVVTNQFPNTNPVDFMRVLWINAP